MKLLLLSDIHGNLSAMEAVLDQMEKFPAIDAAILLGDVIDYGMHSNEIVQIIQSFPVPILCSIRGNHELVILTQDYSRLSSDRCRDCSRYTRSILSENTWSYIKGTMHPTAMQEFDVGGNKCLAVHGSLEDIYWKSIKPGENDPAYAKYDYVFSGHSHHPHFFETLYIADNPDTRNQKKTAFINPGSVGQPRNLSTAAQFAVLDTTTGTVAMEKALYDIEREQRAYTGQVHGFYRTRLGFGV